MTKSDLIKEKKNSDSLFPREVYQLRKYEALKLSYNFPFNNVASALDNFWIGIFLMKLHVTKQCVLPWLFVYRVHECLSNINKWDDATKFCKQLNFFFVFDFLANDTKVVVMDQTNEMQRMMFLSIGSIVFFYNVH